MTENGTIAAIIGRKLEPRGLEILGHSTVPCNGLKKGNVSSIGSTETAVRESVHKVESSTGHSVDSAYIGVTGSDVTFENSQGRLTTAGELGVTDVRFLGY